MKYLKMCSLILYTAISQYKKILHNMNCFFYKLDFHESVYRDTTMKINNKMHYID